jgi:hypothetical protein
MLYSTDKKISSQKSNLIAIRFWYKMTSLEVINFNTIKLTIIKCLNHKNNMFILQIKICLLFALKNKYIQYKFSF